MKSSSVSRGANPFQVRLEALRASEDVDDNEGVGEDVDQDAEQHRQRQVGKAPGVEQRGRDVGGPRSSHGHPRLHRGAG